MGLVCNAPDAQRQGAEAGDPPRLPRDGEQPSPGRSVTDYNCNSCSPFLDNAGTRHLNGADLGAVAQLGERCNRTAEVRSSILLGSTN